MLTIITYSILNKMFIIIAIIIMTWEIILYQPVNEEKDGNKCGRKSKYVRGISPALLYSSTEENSSMQRIRDFQDKTSTPPLEHQDTNRRTTCKQIQGLHFPKICSIFYKTLLISNTWSPCVHKPLK